MFVFETVRSSPKRLVVSAILHVTALALALSLRFATPTTPATARPVVPITITAPSPRITPPPRVPAPTRPAPRAQTRTFSAPTTAAPQRPAPLKVEATLAAPAPTLSISVEPRITATLPPPPVIVGKLTPATTAISDAPERTLRSTTFSTAAPAERPPTKTARLGTFGEASIATSPTLGKSTQAPATAAVEILSKPRPLYTEEARRLRIEGEVLLEVLFTATGTAQVQRILRGLGHGLDESAATSATQIQFRPAQRAGQPVDQTATVHITFQLAY